MLLFSTRWNGIIPAFAKRLTSHETPNGEQSSLPQSMYLQCLHCVVGASWLKPAAFREKRGDKFLINPDQQDHCSCKESAFSLEITPCLTSSCTSSAVACCLLYVFSLCRGIRTRRHGGRRGFSILKLSQRIRRARLRSTARRLNFFEHMTPHPI